MAQKLDQILVIDLEATCWEGGPPEGQESEIIEIGLCILDVATGQRLDNPSLLIQPEHSTVSEYCTRLTTLTQEDLEDGMGLDEACQILEQDYDSRKRLWASYGDYDRKIFLQQCRAKGIDYPFGDGHINVKSLFAAVRNLPREIPLDQALEMLGFPLEGTHHRGGDDAWNIARILGHILLTARENRNGCAQIHVPGRDAPRSGFAHLPAHGTHGKGDMIYDFDRIIDRRGSDSVKWHRYGEDALPLWLADMDFPSPEPVIRALRERIEHGVFGYPREVPGLRLTLVERLERLYDWQVKPEALIFLPRVVTGFNLATHAVTSPGDGVLAQTPVYYPILYAPGSAGCTLDEMELTRLPDGQYQVDFDLFEETLTTRTRIFILCNPHNPVGRVFRREELERMAEICLRHDLVICSDEIHCDLLFTGQQHLPIATLAPEVAERTITLMAPSKTYNIAGLQCSVAIIENDDLRKQFVSAKRGLVSWVNLMGQVAALAAYRDGESWLAQVLQYLEANRDWLYQYVDQQLPGITMLCPEGTYLAWLDCRELGATDRSDGSSLPPHRFFLDRAGVALNDGATFGRGGEGFVRLNFGCPRPTLVKALERMKQALASLG